MDTFARYCIFLIFVFFSSLAYAQTGLVNINQSGDSLEFYISDPGFSIGKLKLTLTGPEQTISLPAECEEDPFSCIFEVVNTNYYALDTNGFATGQYNWTMEILPDTSDTSVCQYSTADIREIEGGLQGLDNQITIVIDFFQCLRDKNILPPEDQYLTEFGTFTISDAVGLISPGDNNNPGANDNLPPVAICQDVTVNADSGTCLADANIDNGSYDPEGAAVTLVQDPLGPYGLGDTLVELTVTDDLASSAQCSGTVTVVDVTPPVAIDCNAPDTITPPDAPVSFTATSSDNCGSPDVAVVSYDCYMYNGSGKRVDKTDSCVIDLAGDTITIQESSGVGTLIDWVVTSADQSGNTVEQTCGLEVVNPGKGNKK